MSSERFLILEITQPEVRSLLWRIQSILAGTDPRKPVHLTLRGPYEREIGQKTVKKHLDALRNDVLRIGGVGRFNNPGEQVVFLGVASPNLRSVWWKPTYPIRDHGFTPHISLYRGSDVVFADRVADFLKREQLELLCAVYELKVYKRHGLPFIADRPETRSIAPWPAASGRVDPLLLRRLQRLVDEYRRDSHGRPSSREARQLQVSERGPNG